MDDETVFLQELIRKMMAAAETDLTGLARKAEIAPSTLTRFMKGDSKFTLSAKTLFKLSRASGVPISYNAPSGELSRIARPDAAEWLAVIEALPAEIGDYALGTLRGLVQTHRARQEQPPPSEPSRARRKR